MKSFYNGRKVALIPPILKGNKYVSDFKAKANYFNEFFILQCSPIVNSSVPLDKSYLTASSLESMKICDDAIVEPLKILFVNSVNQAVFPSWWEKANVIPVHKKKLKNIL